MHNTNLPINLLLSLMLLLSFAQAQEICNNGLDDDNDGLIDCSDPDCPVGDGVFPIREDFDGGVFDNPNWVTTGSAYINTGWLRLTDDLGGQAGSAFLDTAFASGSHVIIEFDYATIDYNGNNCSYGIGDGLAFYLTEGTAGPSIGQSGAALGYSHGQSGDPSRGIDGGFIGIGLDEFGSFYGTNAAPSTCTLVGDDAVTIRGMETSDNLTAYACIASNLLPWNLDIDVASRAEARRVRVLLSPGGVLDLYFDFNDGNGYIPVFFGLSTGQVVPPTFKLGFSASTGGACIAHEVDNVVVAKPADVDVEIAGPSDFNVCDGRIEYTVTAVNYGPNPVIEGYLQVDVPVDVEDVQWECTGCIPAAGSGNAINAGIALAVGDSIELTVSGLIISPGASSLSVAAGIDFACTDIITSDPENSTAEITTALSDTPIEPDLGADTTVCSFPFLLDAGVSAGDYLWQDGSVQQSFSVSAGGTYWVEVSTGNCVARDSIEISDGSFQLDLGPDRNLCAGAVTLDATTAGAAYAWQDGSTASTLAVADAGTYWVDVSRNGCTIRDSVVVQDGSFAVDLGSDTVLCNNSVTLDASEPGADYLWSDGSTGAALAVTAGGTYWVEVTIGSCSNSDTIEIADNSFTVDIGGDRSVCETTILLDATTPGAEYLWQDSSEAATYTAATDGTYTVSVTRDGCTSGASATLEFIDCSECGFHAPTAFSPNRDGYNDQFLLIFDCEVVAFELEIFNRWGERVFATDDIELGWDGTFKGQVVPLDVFTWQATYSDTEVENVFITGVVATYR